MSLFSVGGAVDDGLPRRASLRKTDGHFVEDLGKYSDRIAVLLNGRELTEVTSWDVDTGEVVQMRRNRNGDPITDENGAPTFMIYRGRVEVRWLKVPA